MRSQRTYKVQAGRAVDWYLWLGYGGPIELFAWPAGSPCGFQISHPMGNTGHAVKDVQKRLTPLNK